MTFSTYYFNEPTPQQRDLFAEMVRGHVEATGATITGPSPPVNFQGHQEVRRGVRLLWAYDVQGKATGEDWEIRGDVEVDLPIPVAVTMRQQRTGDEPV